MAIISSAPIEGNYTIVPNALLRNTVLSWKARGLLGYLISLPPDWKINLNHLTTQAPDGKDSMMTGFAELRKAGYIKAQRIRGEQGRYTGMEYVAYNEPQTPDEDYNKEPDNENEEQPINGFTTTGKTTYGKTTTGKSASTKYLVKEELINKDELLLQDDENFSKNSENENPELAKVFKTYDDNIGFPSPLIRDDIVSLIEEGISPDWIIAAIKEAVSSEVRNWKYIAAILNRWKTQGFQSEKPESKSKPQAKSKAKPQTAGRYVPEHEESQTIVKGGTTYFIEGKNRLAGDDVELQF